jgi:hypothetical protein
MAERCLAFRWSLYLHVQETNADSEWPLSNVQFAAPGFRFGAVPRHSGSRTPVLDFQDRF